MFVKTLPFRQKHKKVFHVESVEILSNGYVAHTVTSWEMFCLFFFFLIIDVKQNVYHVTIVHNIYMLRL